MMNGPEITAPARFSFHIRQNYYHLYTGRQTKSTKRIAGKAAQQTENQQLTAERQILARKTKCDLLGLCCDLTASDGPGTWI